MSKNRYIQALQEAVDYIEENLSEPITVQSVCERSSFSNWEFQRVFRAFLGDSVGNYIRGRRLTLAALKLQKSKEERILDIAVEYQFGSQEAFARSFKKQFGLTPGQMRQSTLALSSAKPRLTKKRLEHIALNISREPELKIIEPLDLMGVPFEIDSTLGKDHEVFESVKQHWGRFHSRLHEVGVSTSDKKYGLISASEADMNDEKLIYTAAVSQGLYPQPMADGMVSIQTNRQKYAAFEVKGHYSSCQIIADYVYGIWLPQSNFERAPGFDFELFEANKFRPGSLESVYCYHIPVKA